jgi:hypothetical protein
MILSRWRNARAMRSAKNVASEPLDVKRTCSAQGTARINSSASSMIGSLRSMKVVPRANCRLTASTTAGWAWPSTIGPEPSR